MLIDNIPEANMATFSTSSLSNVSTTSRFFENFIQIIKKKRNYTYNRALAMGRSLEETYAFSGVHHIFDHHKGSGKNFQFHLTLRFAVNVFIQSHEFNLLPMIVVYWQLAVVMVLLLFVKFFQFQQQLSID